MRPQFVVQLGHKLTPHCYEQPGPDTTKLRFVMPGKPNVPRVCEQCQTPFMARADKIVKGQSRFCGRACSAQSRTTKIECLCQVCGKAYLAWPSKVLKQTRFCSRDCQGFSKRVEVDDALQDYQVDPVTGCWIYKGMDAGYPHLAQERGGKAEQIRLTRVVLERTYGVPVHDVRILACHTCDRPSCIRPDHIFPGTPAMNSADMVAKGRQATGQRSGHYTKPERTPRGERAGRAKLTDDLVRYLRARHQQGDVTYVALAGEVGVTPETVSNVVRGNFWKHVA